MQSQFPQFFTTEEVDARLGFKSRGRQARRLIASGELEAVRFGRVFRVSDAALARMLQRLAVQCVRTSHLTGTDASPDAPVTGAEASHAA